MKKIVCFLVTALILSGCASKPKITAPEQTVIPVAAEQAAPVIQTKPADVFKSQQVMTPVEGIEKNKLQISYSMKVIPAEKGYLVKISMIFRNMKDQNASVKPNVTLSDSSGNRIKAYTKNGFLKHAGKVTAEGKRNAASDRVQWANSYWLKEKFQIPPRGIEIGELIYHCDTLNFPMKLTVSSAGQDYTFVVSENPAAQTRG